MYRLKHLSMWQKNLLVLWFGVFMTGIGMSEIMPFLSLYIDELGNFSQAQLSFYSSLVFAAAFLVMAIVSPFWGRLADKKGRKLMLLRSALGMAIVFFSMGFVTNVWQLLLLRALQGAFGGFTSNSNALIAVQAPREKSGQALSILVTGATAGTLLGPLIGGTLASLFGYRLSFHITGIIMFFVFLLTLFFVKEDAVTKKIEETVVIEKPKLSLKMVISQKIILALFITTLSVQLVNMAINPILSLYVKELLNGHQSVTFIAGIVAAMPGISTMIAAPLFGRLGDRIGTNKVLIFGFGLAAVTFLLTSFTQNVTQLMLLRFLTGISDAALFPSIQSLLTKNTAKENTSLIFSYNQSFQSIGSVIGPLIGALIANLFDYPAIFVFCSLLMVVNFFVLRKQQT
ncbi:MFS transporter [uncultured Enterococcus sp.]|uniref:MFS transporter n=1 Tax=uncultured Enterococcus sp. TaxID=167972 RepID=UPI0025F5C97C|nr:MFS transporter [uncultured Enterococcus sp.]